MNYSFPWDKKNRHLSSGWIVEDRVYELYHLQYILFLYCILRPCLIFITVVTGASEGIGRGYALEVEFAV